MLVVRGRVCVAILVVSAAALLGGCGIHPGRLPTGGRVVTNGLSLLHEARSSYEQAAVDEGVLPPSGECFLSVTQPRVLCGPIHVPGSAPPDDWVELPVRLGSTAHASAASLGDASVGASVASGERLVNDAGKEVVFVPVAGLGEPDYAIVSGGPNDRGTEGHVVLLVVLVGLLVVIVAPILGLAAIRRPPGWSRAEREAAAVSAGRAWSAVTASAGLPPLPSTPVPVRQPATTPPVALVATPGVAVPPGERAPGRIILPTLASTVAADRADGDGGDDGKVPAELPSELRTGTADGDAATGATVEVRVLGVVEVVGAPVPDRPAAVELAALLALHPARRFTGEQLRDELFRGVDDGGRSVALETVRVYMASLRKAWGAGHVPSAAGGAGYRLAESVTTDWARFTALVAAADADEGRAPDCLAEALGLVRGSPFAGIEAGSYGWAWGELLVSDMEAAISAAAHGLSGLAFAAGDARQAGWAAGRGLRAVPGDPLLHEDALRAASDDPAVRDRVWEAAGVMLGVADRDRYLGELYTRLGGARVRGAG